MDKVKHLKPAEVPGKEEIITLVEGLLEAAKEGRFVALAVVALETGDGYNEAAVTPAGTRLAMLGGLNLLHQRIAVNLIEEHNA